MNPTTAIYSNRQEDRNELERNIGLSEIGNSTTSFYIPTHSSELYSPRSTTLFYLPSNNALLAKGYRRIVYGDHGPYLEFEKSNFCLPLVSKFGNKIDFDNLPLIENCKYYYYWLHPSGYNKIKVYLQLKSVSNLPNAPPRSDGKKSKFNRVEGEGYADYQRGFYYVDPYQLVVLPEN